MSTLAVMDVTAGVRVCKTCGVTKSLDEFREQAGYKGGRVPNCKRCIQDKRNERRRSNPEKTRAEYQRDNARPAARARSRRYHARKSQDDSFRADRRQRERKRRATNPEHVRNLERQQPSRTTPEGKARRRATAEVWRQANYDKWLSTTRLAALRRRARLREADTRHVTKRELTRLAQRQRQCCAYCGARVVLTVEHVIPVSRGGRHAIGNLVLACLPCNQSKGGRLLVEWTSRPVAAEHTRRGGPTVDTREVA